MRTVLMLLLVSLSSGRLFGGAVVEGTVKLPPPAKVTVHPGKYKTAGPIGKPDPVEAIVYLEGAFPDVPRNPPGRVRVTQKNYQFSPGLLAVQKGTTVEFPNDDEDYHNVFSYAKPKRFDLGRYRKNEKPAEQVLNKPGVVLLYCEIHDHMRGTILVLDTPYFAKTASGKYRLENLPTGKYVLKAWLSEEKILQAPVELKEGETLKIDFQ